MRVMENHGMFFHHTKIPHRDPTTLPALELVRKAAFKRVGAEVSLNCTRVRRLVFEWNSRRASSE